MVPSQNYNFPVIIGETVHGSCLVDAPMTRLNNYYAYGSSNFLESDSYMAEDHEAGPSSNSKSKAREEDDEEKHEEERDGDWLQLSLGHVNMETNNLDPDEQMTKRRNPIELDLLSDKPAATELEPSFYHITQLPPSRQQQHLSSSSPMFLQNEAFLQKTSFGFKQPWSFRPISNPWNPNTRISNPFYSRSYQNPHMTTPFTAINAGSRSNLKLVHAPSRPQSGLWFMLQPAENQTKEPVLPQIPRNYLRIKDGKMTILLIMKYLANKLELDSELEIEITCRGHLLIPSCTLRHVRDAIWCSRDPVILLQGSPTDEHVMILNYARSY